MPAATITIPLREADIAAIDRHRRDALPELSREQALVAIVEAWVAAQPGATRSPADEGMRPEELNASNDM